MGTKDKNKTTLPISFSKLVAIFILTISLFLMVDLGRRAAANYSLSQEAERYHQQFLQAEATHQALESRLAYVQSDAYVEEIARTQLKWNRAGETVVVMVKETGSMSSQNAATDIAAAQDDPGSNSSWLNWWFLFFDTEPPAPKDSNSQ